MRRLIFTVGKCIAVMSRGQFSTVDLVPNCPYRCDSGSNSPGADPTAVGPVNIVPHCAGK